MEASTNHILIDSETTHNCEAHCLFCSDSLGVPAIRQGASVYIEWESHHRMMKENMEICPTCLVHLEREGTGVEI